MRNGQLTAEAKRAIERGLEENSPSDLARLVNSEVDEVDQHITEEQAVEAVALLQQSKHEVATAFANRVEQENGSPSVEAGSSGRRVATDGGIPLGRDDIAALGFSAITGVSSVMVNHRELAMAFTGIATLCLVLHFGAKATNAYLDEEAAER